MSEGVKKNTSAEEGAEAGGVEALSLSSEEEDKGYPVLGSEDNVEAVKLLAHHLEKRPRVKEDGSGEEKSNEVMSFFSSPLVVLRSLFFWAAPFLFLCLGGLIFDHLSSKWSRRVDGCG